MTTISLEILEIKFNTNQKIYLNTLIDIRFIEYYYIIDCT